MVINFGKHAGKSVEFLLLKKPDYVRWVLDLHDAMGPLLSVKNEMIRLIEIFNQKPFLKKCIGCKERVAIRGSFCEDNPIPWWWCNECEPDSIETLKGRIHLVATYTQALDHAYTYCGGRKADLNFLIRILAEAKGLPKRVSEKQAKEFFAAHQPCIK
jgi:hypothetical protein